MGYGSTLISKFVVLASEKAVLQCIIICLSQWIHEGGGTSCGSSHGIYGRWKDFFHLDIHENMTSKQALWTFGFGDSYVCAAFLQCGYFFMWWCHHDLDWGEDAERSFGLKVGNGTHFGCCSSAHWCTMIM
jgi:hypothetical protein